MSAFAVVPMAVCQQTFANNEPQFAWVAMQPMQYAGASFVALPSLAPANVTGRSVSETAVSAVPPVVLLAPELSHSTEATCAVSSVKGRVWKMSQDAEGCRAIQRAFDEAESDAVRVEPADELRGHAWVAARHAHANHVLQRCIVAMNPRALQFIVDELAQGNRVYLAARHKYGCRVLQRLFEHCMPDQLRTMAEVIVANVMDFSPHVYANYVMQHFCEFSEPLYQQMVVKALAPNVRALGEHPFAAAVLAAALECCPESRLLARALVAEEGLLPRMARSRKGSPAVKAALTVLHDTEREAACKQLLLNLPALQSRYGRSVGRSVAQFMKELSPIDNGGETPIFGS